MGRPGGAAAGDGDGGTLDGVPLSVGTAGADPAAISAARAESAALWPGAGAPAPDRGGWITRRLDPLDPAGSRLEVARLLLLARRISAADPGAHVALHDPAGLVEAVVGAPIPALQGGAPVGPGAGLALQRALDGTLRQLLGLPVGAPPAAGPAAGAPPVGAPAAGPLQVPCPTRVGPLEVLQLTLEQRPGRVGPRLRGSVDLWNTSADDLSGLRLIVVPLDGHGPAGRGWEELGPLPPGARAGADLSLPGVEGLVGVDVYVEWWRERAVGGALPLGDGQGAGAGDAADGPLSVGACRAQVEPPDEDGDRAVVLRLEVDNAGEALLEADLLLHLDGEAPGLQLDERVGVGALPPGPRLVEAAVHLSTGAPLARLRWTLRARRLRAAGPLRLRPGEPG